MQKASPQSLIESGYLKARQLVSASQPDDRLSFARAMVLAAVSAYWREVDAGLRWNWSLPEPPTDDLKELDILVSKRAKRNKLERMVERLYGNDVSPQTILQRDALRRTIVACESGTRDFVR